MDRVAKGLRNRDRDPRDTLSLNVIKKMSDFEIKPTTTTTPLDTSEWPLLLKVIQKFTQEKKFMMLMNV